MLKKCPKCSNIFHYIDNGNLYCPNCNEFENVSGRAEDRKNEGYPYYEKKEHRIAQDLRDKISDDEIDNPSDYFGSIF